MQRDLWATPQLVREAKKHGLRLRVEDIRELHRVGLLVPAFHVRDRRAVGAVPCTIEWMPKDVSFNCTYWAREALAEGRLVDPAMTGFQRHHPFRRPTTAPRGWWDGYMFSPWSELAFPLIQRVVATARSHHRGDAMFVRFSAAAVAREHRRATELRALANVLSVIDARFLPVLDPNWVTLSGIDHESWQIYRSAFNSAQMLHACGVDAEEIALLAQAVEVDDGLGREFGALFPFARAKTLERTSGSARRLYSARKAGEVVARLLEDLDPPNEELVSHIVDQDQRRLVRRSTLDEALQEVGLSPHPGVLLVVEGATELLFVERVLLELGMHNDPSIIHVVDMGGDAKKVELVAAAFAPIVSRQLGDSWELVRPPTRLVVATDPPTGRRPKKSRQQVLRDAMSKVVRAQTGADLHVDAAHMLVEVVEWSGSCFELAHFEDEEIADAIVDVNPDLKRHVNSTRVAEVRAMGQTDIRKVWSGTGFSVRKTDLAHALWPVMQKKLSARPLEHVPDVVDVVSAAWGDALRLKQGRWHLPVNENEQLARLERPLQKQSGVDDSVS